MKTLFVSDLDGTLMRSDKTLSEKTVQTLNRLIENGVLFTYATARSIQSAMEITGNCRSLREMEPFLPTTRMGV